MKFREFRQKMQKDIFTSQEAKLIAFNDNPKQVNLQLHQWKKQGELIQLKRGLFIFPKSKADIGEIAKNIYSPSYISLEYALNYYSIIPDVAFTLTLVTTRNSRKFKNEIGHFTYQKIKKEAFTGFDPKTLMAEPEKALVDYFYLHSHRIEAHDDYWEESRLYGEDLNFRKVFAYARLFRSNKLNCLLKSFHKYVKANPIFKGPAN